MSSVDSVWLSRSGDISGSAAQCDHQSNVITMMVSRETTSIFCVADSPASCS